MALLLVVLVPLTWLGWGASRDTVLDVGERPAVPVATG
jgi:hypothetical protein